MKVPKYIRAKMHRVVELNRSAAFEMIQVEEWLENHGYNIEEMRGGDGSYLEELEYGNDIVDLLCEKLEATP